MRRLERADRVLIERGHKNDVRHQRWTDFTNDVEARHSRHLDVQVHKIGRRITDRVNCARTICTFLNDGDIACALKQRSHAAPGEPFIVDDYSL